MVVTYLKLGLLSKFSLDIGEGGSSELSWSLVVVIVGGLSMWAQSILTSKFQ